jgi:hypothetical protein
MCINYLQRFMKKFAKKGKGQYGLALWAKFVGRYYLYQVIIIDYYMAFFILHDISTRDAHISPRAQ